MVFRRIFLLCIALILPYSISAQSSVTHLETVAIGGPYDDAVAVAELSTRESLIMDVDVKPIKGTFQKPPFEPFTPQRRFITEEEALWQKLPIEGDDPANSTKKDKFHWKTAMKQSLIMLGFQHAVRFTQTGMRRELRGPFFRDWGESVRSLHGWKDGDSVFINYVAHSMQGATTSRIFINNSDKAKRQEFGKSKQYWESRFKAMAWSAVWSTQFELGPISEASLGNIGTYTHRIDKTMAWGDLIVTPVLGTSWAIGEDAIDKYILKNWVERGWNGGPVSKKVKILRSFLTPTTSIANLLRGNMPWKRDNRR